ncbi:MAG: UvrB/UvrC motif-containing protein [Dictyoglomus sp.]
MWCDFCGKNKAFYILEIADEKGKKKYALCEECLHQMIKDIFQVEFMVKEEVKKCPKCGREWKDIEETGMVGCHHCYEFFGEDLEKIIIQYHGNRVHKGRVPQKDSVKSDRILRYKVQISKAIEEEDYEKAAKLRDFLKNIEKRGE